MERRRRSGARRDALTQEQLLRLMYAARTDPDSVQVLHDVLFEQLPQYRAAVDKAMHWAIFDSAYPSPATRYYVTVDPKRYAQGRTRSGKSSYERGGYKMLSEHPFVMILGQGEMKRGRPNRDGWRRSIVTYVAKDVRREKETSLRQ